MRWTASSSTACPTFGRYEDAIMGDDWAMSHSLLSVPLNLGVLHPLDAVEAAEDAYRQHERTAGRGRGLHPADPRLARIHVAPVLALRPGYTRNNELAARAPRCPNWWRELDADAVTAECLRHALTGVRDRGWTHHIQRLMVLGNHALQRGYRPAELTEWFATAYVDGFRWVMPTNVVGMSQHADGGLAGHQAVHLGRRLHQQDERPLR